jgi:quercetin dioxygenase-like cupin family protein
VNDRRFPSDHSHSLRSTSKTEPSGCNDESVRLDSGLSSPLSQLGGPSHPIEPDGEKLQSPGWLRSYLWAPSLWETPARERSAERPLMMSSDLRNSPSAKMAGAREVFSPPENLPPANVWLTKISENDADYCVILCSLPAGAIVPMHSHADRETFYVLSGSVEGLRVDRWITLGPGDVLDVADGIKHAWRNSSQAAVSMLCVTTMRMARFLRDISVADGVSTRAEHNQRFLELAQANGYWLASPEENAEVGLAIDWD